MAVSDLSGPDAVLAVLAVATGVALLVAAAVLYLVRRPPEPPVGARTLDLGPESPALANFLVRDFRVTDEAVPATLIDLAARTRRRRAARPGGLLHPPPTRDRRAP